MAPLMAAGAAPGRATAALACIACLAAASAFQPPAPALGKLSPHGAGTILDPARHPRTGAALPRLPRAPALRMGREGEGKTWRSAREEGPARGSWAAEVRKKAAILKSARRFPLPPGPPRDEPQRFLRLQRTGDRSFELQTAVVTYCNDTGEGEPRYLDLVSLVHLGDPHYFRELKEHAESMHDRVLFELIADSSLIETDSEGRRRLKQRLVPAPDQRILARKHGLQAQLEGLDLTGDKWVLADLDRESIQSLQRERGEAASPSLISTLVAGWGSGEAKALPSRTQSLLRTWLRAPIWLVPCPEGALLLLDWALSERGRLSDVLGAMLSSLLAFDSKTASKLAFAQLLASGSMRCEGPQTVIIEERNKAALEELRKHGGERTALLYGGMHGPDLDKRLTEEEGFARVGCEWKTAWRMYVPGGSNIAAKLGAALAAYMLVDGADWINTISVAAQEASGGAWDGAAALAIAYLLRHGALYWQLGRLLVSWDSSPFEYAASSIERANDDVDSTEPQSLEETTGEKEAD